MDVPGHVNESIDTLVDLHSRSERDKTKHQRGVERLASILGRPRSLYVLAFVVSAWAVANVVAPRNGWWAAFDPPPFPMLEALISTVALTVTLIVLTSQNRQSSAAQKRSLLELQINMLSERKATKIIELLESLRRDMPSVANRLDAEALEMSKALDPKLVADAIDKSIATSDDGETVSAAKSSED